MFQTPKTVRDAVKTQSELVAEMTDRVIDWQLDSYKAAEKQIATGIDAARTALETNAKATRAMQKSFVDGLTPTENTES